MKFLMIGFGGFIGALLRYGLTLWVHRMVSGFFPYGTLAVNASGCLVIGCLMTLIEEGRPIPENLGFFLLVGLLGAFTTFSTFGWETFALINRGELKFGVLNIFLNMALGLGALVLGHLSTKFLLA